MAPRLNPRLKGFASEMRNAPTPIEAALWKTLRSSQLAGLKFRRQTVIGPYIADFFCPAIGLVIELDGRTHDQLSDARRDKAMNDMGFHVLRFSNQELGHNMDGVLRTIVAKAETMPPRFTSPPLQGRGERRRSRPGGGERRLQEAEPAFAPHPPTPSPEGKGESA